MSEMSEKARAASKAKAKAMANTNDPHERVDASTYTDKPRESALNADVQTGMRPISPRQFKRGGRIGIEGHYTGIRPDRKRRATGGATNAYINRDVKAANEERPGTKHIGGMKKGGRAHKLGGGPLQSASGAPMNAMPPTTVMRKSGGRSAHAGGGKVHADAAEDKKLIHAMGCKCAKCSGGRVARASGGRTKKGKGTTNVNIIIGAKQPAPPMPVPMRPPVMPPGGPPGLHQAPPPPAAMPPAAGAAPPMGAPMMRKDGGRVEKYPLKDGGGGAKGRLQKIAAYGETPP